RTHTRTPTHTHTHTHTHTNTHTHTHTDTHTHTRTHRLTQRKKRTPTHTHTHRHRYTQRHTHRDTHTHRANLVCNKEGRRPSLSMTQRGTRVEWNRGQRQSREVVKEGEDEVMQGGEMMAARREGRAYTWRSGDHT